jgi:hypothetical protein
MTADQARTKRAEAVARRRLAERICRSDFLWRGDAHQCTQEEPCSRDYDPMPYPEALPKDLRMYEGTGIGAIYGLDYSTDMAWQLAGWNIGRQS